MLLKFYFILIEMGKTKRLIKKKIAKHKIQKKNIKKTNNNNSNSNEKQKENVPMSRLEYEQSMMDPRFKAAMMGFNNPNGYFMPQMQHQIRNLETKNNELTREATYKNDIEQ